MTRAGYILLAVACSAILHARAPMAAEGPFSTPIPRLYYPEEETSKAIIVSLVFENERFARVQYMKVVPGVAPTLAGNPKGLRLELEGPDSVFETLPFPLPARVNRYSFDEPPNTEGGHRVPHKVFVPKVSYARIILPFHYKARSLRVAYWDDKEPFVVVDLVDGMKAFCVSVKDDKECEEFLSGL